MREANARANVAAYHLALGQFDQARRHARASLVLCRHLQSPQMTAVAMEHLAHVAVAHGDARHAARLSGYIDAWYAREALEREWTEQQCYERFAARLREALSKDDLDRYRAEGAGFSQEDAFEEALAAPIPQSRSA